MTTFKLETGTMVEFENLVLKTNENRVVSLVCDDDKQFPMYYVAKAELWKSKGVIEKSFRSAGIVENLFGVRSLMQWSVGQDWNADGLDEG